MYPSVVYHETRPAEQNLLELLSEVSWFQEEPVGSSSVLAQYLVYKLAKDNNVTVLVDGQGADEYLAGYVPIYNIYLEQLFEQNPWLYRKEHAAFCKRHDASFHKPAKEFDESFKAQAKQLMHHLWGEKVPAEQCAKSLRKHLRLLTTTTTLKELLRYADRNSMAHSREVRLPFLSHELVEFVHSLPDSYLLKSGWTKYILRKSMNKALPAEILWRTDKVGYEPPQNKWMESSDVTGILVEQRKKYDIAETKNVSYTNSTDWRLLADSFV